MRILRFFFLMLPLGVLTVGCATTRPVDMPQRLVLLAPLSVPEGRARLFLQSGKVVQKLDEFTPHCALEIDRVSGLPRTVPVGVYAVRRVQDVSTTVVLGHAGPQLAGVGIGISIGSGGRVGVGVGIGAHDIFSREELFEGYHFWLADTARVGLMRLTCLGARAEPADVNPPSRAEMAAALGSLARLE